MEKTRRRGWRKSILGLSAIIFAASFIVSLVPSIRAIAEGAIFKIKSAEITQLSSGVDGAISSHDDSTIVSDVTFHKLGDTATYKVVLQNTDSKDHVIETISDDNANSHISYSYDKHANETITAGSNLDFVFEAKYAKTPNTNERQQVSKVKFSIRFTDIDEPEEIIVAPSTYDGLGASFVVLAISSLGLIVCVAIYIKNHKKAAKVLTVALVAALATAAITGVKAATVEVNSFTLTTNYGFYDKIVITYTDKNGDEQELISDYNEPANIPDQNKDGYTLTGWEDEQGNPVDPTQPIIEDVKIHPIYRTHTYTIKFNGNGANGEMTNLAMTYDEAKTLPANAFDFPGHTYTGWDTEANGSGIHYDNQAEVKNLTAEDNGIVTLYAQWSINPFHIDYDGNGATSGEMATTNCEYDQACQLRDNAFEKTGYHFIGWKYNNNDYANKADVKNIIESGTITMVAQWEVNHYTIVFNINTDDSNASGDMADMANLEYGQDYTLTANAFTRTGYNFGGWNTEIDGRNFGLTDEQEFHNLTTTDNAVITLYAQWNPIRYNVVFHQNRDGVTGNTNSMTNIAYDDTRALTQNGFELAHYKFMGWNSAEDGTGTPYEDKASIKNLTATDGVTIDLYAQWKERTATLNTGANVRTALKGLADAPTTFKKYDGENLPDFNTLDGKVDIALADSNFPVWAWADGDNIYWWSEAERPNFNRNSSTMFQSMTTLTTIDLDGLESSTAVNMANLFNGCTSLTDLDISEFNTANVENMSAMFHDTPALTSINTAALNTVNVKDMSSMFRKTGATSIDISNFDTGNVKTMARMFEYAGASSITLGNPNTLNVTNMSLMFSETAVTSLDVSGLDTDNVENMNGMFEAFYVPSKLTSLDVSNFKTSKVQNFACMFYGQAKLTSLDVSNFDTSSATSMYMMFISMTKAESINVSGWTNDLGPRMDYMFSYTGMGVAGGTVINFENFNTENVTNMDHMFSDMRSETVLDLSGFDTAKVTKMGGMFSSSYASTPMALKTVYVSDKFVTTALTGTQNNIFDNTRAIVGGAGTAWDASSMEKARIDDPDNGEPGYFTLKNARYIRYHDNDGNDTNDEANYALMKSHYLKAGGSLTKNTFVRGGYVFTGWKDADNNEYTDEQVMTGLIESKTPLELYAQWEPATFTISFDSNIDGSTGTMDDQTVTHGTQTPLSANAFKKDHWRFLGWTTSQESNVVGNESQHVDFADQAEAGNITEDLVLHAKWLFRCRTFETDSWATIVANLENDPNYYDATDVCEKVISMPDDNGNTQDYTLRLINTSTPEECATAGFSQTGCGTVIEFGTMATLRRWNPTGTTAGGWKASELNGWLNSTFYDRMPEDLKNVIIPTYLIVSGNGQGQDSPDITAADVNLNKIFLPTRKEFGMNASEDNAADRMRTWDFYTIAEHRSSYVRNRQGGGTWPRASWDRSARNNRTNLSTADAMGTENRVATYPVFRIGRKFTVSFNAGEGAASETAREYAVSAMNYSTLPTVTTAPEGKIFAGWYTAAEGGDRVNDNNTFVSSNAHTLYAHWITPTFYNITEMQQMTADICATATTPKANASQFDTTGENVGDKSYIPRRELIDNRDGKSYQVTKLADGKCWMTENLALGDPDSTMTLTSADSDVTSSLTLPRSNIAAFTGSADVDAVYVDDTFGGYYSSKVARANYTNEGDSSICPKGWRLPNATMSAPRDWENLQSTYDISSVNALYGEPFNLTRSFYVSNGAIKRNNGWLDTYYVGPGIASDSNNNFGVYIPDNWTGTSRITGAEGGSARCVAR